MHGPARHDRSIQIGHVIDHYFGATNVFHFTAIDDAEASLDTREGRQQTGEAVTVHPDELRRRATALVADPIFQNADCIGKHFSWCHLINKPPLISRYTRINYLVINCELDPSFRDEWSLEKYLSYLQGRSMRTKDGAVAMCNAIREISRPNRDLQIFLLFNELSCLPVSTKGGLEECHMAVREGYAAWKKLSAEASTMETILICLE